jgi:hypothetical protein
MTSLRGFFLLLSHSLYACKPLAARDFLLSVLLSARRLAHPSSLESKVSAVFSGAMLTLSTRPQAAIQSKAEWQPAFVLEQRGSE